MNLIKQITHWRPVTLPPLRESQIDPQVENLRHEIVRLRAAVEANRRLAARWEQRYRRLARVARAALIKLESAKERPEGETRARGKEQPAVRSTAEQLIA